MYNTIPATAIVNIFRPFASPRKSFAHFRPQTYALGAIGRKLE
jgi:hypothetical protein